MVDYKKSFNINTIHTIAVQFCCDVSETISYFLFRLFICLCFIFMCEREKERERERERERVCVRERK